MVGSVRLEKLAYGLTPGSGAACDDSDPCTANDTCVTGACVGASAECSCTVNSDCKNFDDGNVCNGAESCQNGTCVLSTPPLVRVEL